MDMANVIVQGTFSVDPSERDRFVETSVDAMRSSRQEEGCLEYVMAADPLDPERVVLSERWESMDHLQEHLAQQKSAARGVDARRYLGVSRSLSSRWRPHGLSADNGPGSPQSANRQRRLSGRYARDEMGLSGRRPGPNLECSHACSRPWTA